MKTYQYVYEDCPNCKNNQTSPDYNCSLCGGIGEIEIIREGSIINNILKWIMRAILAKRFAERCPPEVKYSQRNMDVARIILAIDKL